MSADPLGFGRVAPPILDRTRTTHVIVQQPLRRVMAAIGLSIDDVVNDPVCRNLVFGYYKLYKNVKRTCETVDLERWWNGV